METNLTAYPSIRRVLQQPPPAHLFHYTSPAGLIGIFETRELWATHVRFLNDRKELIHAADISRSVIERRLQGKGRGAVSEGSPAVPFLEELQQYLGNTASDIYVASLTEKGDLLSQWRAYCPAGGGYAIGFPSGQVATVATEQSFLLSPCVYDTRQQLAIVDDILDAQIGAFVQACEAGAEPVNLTAKAAACARELNRYGAMLKHPSFSEEAEWRLISRSPGVNSPKLLFRPARHSIVPYLKFKLTTKSNPNLVVVGDVTKSLLVVVGPTAEPHAATFAVQALGHRCFVRGVWHRSSAVPYRGI